MGGGQRQRCCVVVLMELAAPTLSFQQHGKARRRVEPEEVQAMKGQ